MPHWRSSLLAALTEAAQARVTVLDTALRDAQAAVQRAQVACGHAWQAAHDAQDTFARIRDAGQQDQHVAHVLQGDRSWRSS